MVATPGAAYAPTAAERHDQTAKAFPKDCPSAFVIIFRQPPANGGSRHDTSSSSMAMSPNQQPNDDRMISLVVPCYREEANIGPTVEQLIQLLAGTNRRFEIIAVDDGSPDDTWQAIQQCARKHPQVIGVRHMRNYGQTQAYNTGFDQAKGDLILTCSADLESPFETLLEIIKHLESGYDFVNTCRDGRWTGRRAIISRIANWVINRVSGLNIQDRGSGMKGMCAPVAKSLRLYGEMHRFLPDYASIHTTRIIEIPTSFQDRETGVSAYQGQRRALNVLLDSITLLFALSASRKPFRLLPGRIFGFCGVIVLLSGFAISTYLVFTRVFLGHPLSDRPLFWVSMLWSVLGVVMVMLGMLGEMMLRLFHTDGRSSQVLARDVVKQDINDV